MTKLQHMSGNPEAEFFEHTANVLGCLAHMSQYAKELQEALEFLDIKPAELEALAKRHNVLARFMYQTGEVPQPEAKMGPIPDYGDHMTMVDFLECCECGGFIDYDGSGCYATAEQKTNIGVIPSDVAKCKLDPRWTHVVWFNK